VAYQTGNRFRIKVIQAQNAAVAAFAPKTRRGAGWTRHNSAGHQVLPVGLPAPSRGVSPGFQSNRVPSTGKGKAVLSAHPTEPPVRRP